jgi:hypothetical protein
VRTDSLNPTAFYKTTALDMIISVLPAAFATVGFDLTRRDKKKTQSANALITFEKGRLHLSTPQISSPPHSLLGKGIMCEATGANLSL